MYNHKTEPLKFKTNISKMSLQLNFLLWLSDQLLALHMIRQPVLSRNIPTDEQVASYATQKPLTAWVMDYKSKYDEYPTAHPDWLLVFARGDYFSCCSLKSNLRKHLDEYFDIHRRIHEGERVDHV